jgi:hypothetical protein
MLTHAQKLAETTTAESLCGIGIMLMTVGIVGSVCVEMFAGSLSP